MDCVWNGQRLVLDHAILNELPRGLIDSLHYGTNAQHLDILADIALDPRWTALIYSTHKPLFVDICSRWTLNTSGRFEPLNVVIALSRILPLASHLSIYVEQLVCKQRVDVFNILHSRNATGLSELPDVKLIPLLIVINRLLEFNDQSFASIISPIQLQVLLQHSQLCVRYLAIKALCLFLHAADATMIEMVSKYVGKDEVEGQWENRVIDYRFLQLWEERRLQDLQNVLQCPKNAQTGSPMPNAALRTIGVEDLSPLVASFAGVMVPTTERTITKESSLVVTNTTSQNLQAAAQAISGSKPVLVTGVSGSGKSSVIRHIARRLAKFSTMLTLHLNEQTDAKLLVGMYTSGAAPGSFEWRQGVLTTAVLEGRWVFIKDLDRAPAEVISTFLPLLDRGELNVPNLGGSIRAAQGFKLIATVRSFLNTSSTEVTPGLNMLGIRHWNPVHFRMLSDQDLSEIILTTFPVLHAYEPQIMNLYRELGLTYYGASSKGRSSRYAGRTVSPHDLLRYCSRLRSLLSKAGVKTGVESISEAVHDSIFLEAVDCFSGSLQSEAARTEIVAQIAKELHVAPQRAQYCTQIRTPEYLDCDTTLSIGRVTLTKHSTVQRAGAFRPRKEKRPFAITDHTLRQLERIGAAIAMNEPCLLVGETGTGKTTMVQELASRTGHNLVVVNLSQQSEAGDLLGGYKPVNVRAISVPMQEEFEDLFDETFSAKKNQRYIASLAKTIARGEWSRTLTLWREALKLVEISFTTSAAKLSLQAGERSNKRRKVDSPVFQGLKKRWDDFASRVDHFHQRLSSGAKSFSFSFVEGNIVKAVRNGDWVLLDEINLASPDTLDSLADLIFDKLGDAPSILLTETGDIERVYAHADFRIFGAMNPATDIGKRDLAMSLRSRFAEYYINSPDKDPESLKVVIKAYLGNYVHSDIQVTQDIAQLYLKIQKLSEENRLVDGANQKPHYSLRTLTRLLTYVTDIAPLYGLRRALHEGFSMSFLTLLNRESEMLVVPLINTHILGAHGNRRALLHQVPRHPSGSKEYIQFRHYWVARGSRPIEEQPQYIITPFIEANLLNLVRATSTRRFPVLLQGPTSSGKTSMIEYLAKVSGNKFVRINNHEHTDLQEYLGTYVSDPEGRLHYQEGVLVHALREGHWIVLDELNLAPTDVLEALNRLLDDNRELFIPETQQIVRPHENFMLFATQNPPGLYGGRKVLSRAFRNRFLELHFDDIPETELETILRERTQIAPSFCTRIVAVYKKLAVLRQSGRLFEQKQSFATLRDLFRWAMRDADDRDQLALNGFMLLAERVRNPDERLVVKQVVEEVMKVKINETQMYNSASQKHESDQEPVGSDVKIVWTRSMRRLHSLVTEALKKNEPVLLVGPTGCGKTSVCQVISRLMHNQLHIFNAHQNTETGDLIGAQRPIRNRTVIEARLIHDLALLFEDQTAPLPDHTNSLQTVIEAYTSLSQEVKDKMPVELRQSIECGIAKSKQLFEWVDGSLVSAMRAGNHFLLDEISLADDSVIERLNSVLEPGRALLLAERGPREAAIKASDGFQFLATMNPGGDYGKRELSPALRNRFTEIWVPPFSSSEDILEIAEVKLIVSLRHFAQPMLDFAAWYILTFEGGSSPSLRQILSWVDIMNRLHPTDPYVSVLHGAAMVYIDAIGANPSAKLFTRSDSISAQRCACLKKLTELFKHDMALIYNQKPVLARSNNSLKIGIFELQQQREREETSNFILEAPTTLNNALRIFRALQLPKPVLLEGSPGVGKTALVTALADAVGIPLTRINLSEQTDIMDLFGSDVPVEGGSAGQFAWRDGPFLQAMQRGEWVLLDEMNLASQSILEGLNACLDHRGQVYIPELDQEFSRHARFVLFATQNPHRQGGGRKGLPASFVNRFTVVYADLFTATDYLTICGRLYPNIPSEKTDKIVRYVTDLTLMTQNSKGLSLNGGPWEFNLRDMLRWLHLLDSHELWMPSGKLEDYQRLLFLNRLRSPPDVAIVVNKLASADELLFTRHYRFSNLSSSYYQCGLGLLGRKRKGRQQSFGRHIKATEILESMVLCVQHNWPCLVVGSSGSGKSSLVRYLGSVVGADIVELTLNSDMDTMDLLGGYEQVNVKLLVIKFLRQLRSTMEEVLTDAVLSSGGFAVASALLELLIEVKYPKLDSVLQLLHKLRDVFADSRCIAVIEQCSSLVEQTSVDIKARFEWVDGALVKAVKTGQWLVLDNANLCSSSVLDRLNSLLEPGGILLINEHRAPDGSPQAVKPHKDFRLFLTMDPRHGELSRAMRNRCIELFIYADVHFFEPDWKRSFASSELHRILVLGNIDWNNVDDSIIRALSSICIDHLSFRDFQALESWLSQAGKGLLDIKLQKLQLLSSVASAFLRLASQHAAIFKTIWKRYHSVCTRHSVSEDFCDAQTIHPLNNTSMLPFIQADQSSIGPVFLAGILEALVELEIFKHDFLSTESSLHHKSASQMSRLERSIMSTRVLAFTKDSTQPLAGFLTSSVQYLSAWLEEQARHAADAEVTDFLLNNSGQSNSYDVTIAFVKEIIIYIEDLVALTQLTGFDEAVFQAYLAIGRSLVERALQCPDLHMLAQEIQNHLKSFGPSWDLSTGSSMKLLWASYKPPTASDSYELDLVLKFERLVNSFDSIVWRCNAPIDMLTNMRCSILRVNPLETAASLPEKDKIMSIAKAIDDIEGSLSHSATLNYPYFKDEFEGLRQYNVENSGNQVSEKRHTLELLACWASRHSVCLLDCETAYTILKQVRDFAGFSILNSSLATVKNVLPISIMTRLVNIADVPLKSLDLLGREVLLLGDYTAHACHSVSQDQYKVLNHYLGQLQLQFLDAHAAYLDAESVLVYKNYLSATQATDSAKSQAPLISPLKLSPRSNAPKQLQEVISTHIQPSLEALQRAAKEASPLAPTSIAWVSFFTGCLLLYIPDRPFDPALKPIVDRDRFLKHKIGLEMKLKALRLYEEAFTNNTTNIRCELVEKELQTLGTQPQVPRVVRPAISELPQVQGEFANLLSSVVRKSPGPQSILSVVETDKAAMQDLRMLRENIERAVQRLSDNFRSYDDIIKPAVGLLEGLDVGLALATAASMQNAETNKEVEAIFICTPFLGLQLGYLGFTEFTETTALKSSSLRTSVLKVAAIERGITGCMPYSLMSSVVEIFQVCYENWKKQLVDGQHEHSAKASLYRYRGSQAESETSSDQEFNLLFPSYNEELQGEFSAHNDDRQNVQTLASDLAELQRQILMPHQAPADQITQMLQHATGEIVRAWKVESNSSIFPVHPKHMLSGLVVALSVRIKNLLYSNPSNCEYNFYVDVNLAEARKLVALLTQVEQRFRLIQQHWPEHATLEDVLRTSREILAFKHTDPLAKIITKCEQLHGHIHEWQVVASREHSATSEYNRLTELLIGWRRLELSTWARLLDMEDEKCTEDAKAWWFVAYEAIIAASVSITKTGGDISHHAQELVATLNKFFSQTSVGQFCERLRLIEAFKYHIDLLCKELPSLLTIRAAIINFLRYQMRFKVSVMELNRNSRRLLEKDLKEVVLLASWKDTNIMALRESAKKSHHKLFKIIRKYRTLLARPTETTIGQEIPKPVILEWDHVPSTNVPLAVDQIALETCKTNVHAWNNKPSRYTEPNETAFRMYKSRRQMSSAFDCSLYLDSFSTNLLENTEVLKKETPATQTNENKHIIKHLKTRKRRIFTDTLKEVKSMGFTSNPDTDILSKQATLPVVLGTSPALESDLLSDGINVAEYYFHKCLENMAIVRLTAQQHSEDLTSGEVARCLGYLESMLFILLRQREFLSALLADHGSFQRLLEKWKSLWAPERYTLQVQGAQKYSASFEATERCIKWLCCIIDVAVVVITQHNKLGHVDTPIALEGLGQWTQRLGSLAIKFAQLPALPLGLSTSLHAQTLKESQSALDQLSADLERWKNEEPLISFALDQVLLWTCPGTNMDDTHTNGMHLTSVSEFDQEISNIIDTILVGMQQMQEAFSATPLTSEGKAWLLRADASQIRSIKALHVNNVSGMTENVLCQLLYISSMTPSSLEVAAARCAVALPIIEQYEIIHLDAIRQYLRFHTSLGRLVCVLTTCFKEIVALGFCSPSEKSSTEDGKAENLEGGTGLGDGTGAADISKDIQDDEDLSELAQDGSKHETEEGIEDEEDAVDMQQDELDGELGEAVEDKDVDASDAQSDDSNDVLDDQVGEVDNLDPSAVDEKLWEGSTDDAGKDEKGCQSKEKKQEEVAAQDDPRAAEDDQMEAVGCEETDNISQEEMQKTDPHLQEGDKLDLPEEMDLDDEAKPKTDIDVDDEEIDNMSDIDQQDPGEANEDETSSPDENVEHSGVEVEDDNEMHKEFSDHEMTGEAASPIDTDPDESTEGNEEGFIQEITDDAVANAENAALSDVRGTSDNNEPQTDNKTQTESAAKGESGEKGDDAAEATAQSAIDKGQVGQASAKTKFSQSQQDLVPDTNEIEAFRKLGDALEQWHRLSQLIKQTAEYSPRIEQASNDEKPRDQEFEHLPDDDAETNMQALAAATEDQAHALNSQAMESEAQDLPKDFMLDETMAEEAIDDDRRMDEIDEDMTGSEHQDKSIRAGADFGPSTGSQDRVNIDIESKDEREQDIEELDTELSTVHLTGEDLASLRSVEDSRRLWSYYEGLTRELALSLTEQLRLVLAPTLATKMRGDFRTGKRLNIKRIIPYIASQYKRDKIWMRRSIPSKRNYQVLLAVDDSKSMGESGSGQLAFETLALISKSLSMLEIGQICIVGFGDDIHVAHGFDQTFSPEAGVQVFQQFRFQKTSTNVQKLLVGSLELFRDARGKSFNAGKDLWQLELIISDGVCEDHDSIRRLVRQAQEERIVIIFVIVDSLKGESIMDMTQATFEPDEAGETKLKIRKYLDDFPFGYYLIVGDVKELPGVLAATLREWFTEVAESG